MKKLFTLAWLILASGTLVIAQSEWTPSENTKISGKEKSLLQNKNLTAKTGMPGFSAQSVAVPYNFSYYTGTYTNLSASTSLNAGFTWDDPSYTVPLGFNFILWNDTVSTLDFTGLGGWLVPGFAGLQPFVYYLSDIADRASTPASWEGDPGSLSNISYLTSGSPGNRICKVEWANSGFYDDISEDTTSTDYLNFQMWLYEGSNNIEFHFGLNSVVQDVHFGFPGPVVGVGLYDFNMDTIFFYCLQGNPASPSATTNTVDLNAGLTLVTLSNDPPNGIIYKFTWALLGINEFEAQNNLIDINPNPVSSSASLLWKTTPSSKIALIVVMDVLGRTLQSEHSRPDNEGRMKLDLTSLSPGSYTVKISSDEKIIYKKLIKQ